MIFKILYLVLIVFLSSCAKQTVKSSNKPSWLIDLGSYSNRFVATGCSGIHARGLDAQKKLATSRAVDKLAMQKGVVVNTVMDNKVKRNNGAIISSTYKSKSSHRTSNIKVKFNVLKSYFDEQNKDYCILIESSN